MPTYDYRCETTGQVAEVSHRMSEDLTTWGEVCGRAGIPLGDAPAHSPVQRLATGGQVIANASLKNPEAPACGMGGCGGGMCGMA